MKNLLHKGLLYKDFKNSKWVGVLILIELLFMKLVILSSELKYVKNALIKRNYKDPLWFNHILFQNEECMFFIIVSIMLLVIILFYSEKNSLTQNFSSSIPVTKKQIIFNKYFLGISIITISLIVVFLGVSLFYICNIKWINVVYTPFSYIIKYFFINWLEYSFIFTFLMFTQCFMGNNIISIVVGILIPCIPFAVFNTICEWLNKQFDYHVILNGFQETYLLPYEYIFATRKNIFINSQEEFIKFYDKTYLPKLIILLILIVIFSYFAFKIYSKRQMENNCRVLTFKNLDYIFTVVFSVCLGISSALIFGYGFCDSNIMFYIFLIIGIIVGILICRKFTNPKERINSN